MNALQSRLAPLVSYNLQLGIIPKEIMILQRVRAKIVTGMMLLLQKLNVKIVMEWIVIIVKTIH